MRSARRTAAPLLVGLLALLLCGGAFALDWHNPGTGQGILDQVIQRFADRAAGWATIITAAAERLFWSLALISLVWTGGTLMLKRADIGEFFAELFRFIVFIGFFLWLLRNGPAMAIAVINSMRQMAEQASGVRGVSPSGVVDIGFLIWHRAIESMSLWKPVGSFAGALLSAGILVVLALVASNMLLLLVSAWLLAYAGVFVLGFGGSRWTSDMAIHYFKTVLALGLQVMTMVLVVGIGTDLLTAFYGAMTGGTLNFDELAIMFVFAIVLLVISNKLPPMVGGLVSGGSIGGGGIGNFGAGAVVGAAMSAANTAAGAAKLLGAAAASTGANALGGASALTAALRKGQGSSGGGAGVMDAGAFGRGGDGGGGGSASSKSKGTGTAGDTPFAQAAGFSFGPSSGATLSTGKSSAGTDSPGGFNLPIGDAESAGTSAGGAEASGGASAPGDGGSSSSSASSATGSSGGAEASGASGGGGGGSPSGPGGKAQGRGRLATAGAIAAGTGAALAQGIADVATDKMDALKEAGRKRIAATLGGQVAAAIERSGGDAKGKDGGGDAAIPSTPDPSPTFGGNSLAGADDSASASSSTAAANESAGTQRKFTDEQLAEISAFVNKGQPLSEA